MIPLALALGLVLASASPAHNTDWIDLGQGIRVEFRTAQFDETEHQIEHCEIIEYQGVCLIDDRPVFGADWLMPRTVLASARVVMADGEIPLDVSCMYNPMVEPSWKGQFSLKRVEGGHLIRGEFSDGGGSYHAEWFITAGTSVRTALWRSEH